MMLRAFLLHVTNLSLAAMATAQNLVPNPSFEDTTYCIGWPPPQLEAVGWYTANYATPDIWDCDTVNPCGYHVMDPNDSGIQLGGYKYAYDGDRFAGGVQWYGNPGSNNRDYHTAKLLEPLEVGQNYRVSLWVALRSSSNGVIDHIGAYFGSDSVHEPYFTTLPFEPQAKLRDASDTYLDDTAWVEISDTIVASGNEEWIIIGTFDNADEVNGIWLGWGPYPPKAYYLFDLVSVELVQPLGNDKPGGFESRLVVSGPWIRWNGSASLEQLRILDGSGRAVWRAPNDSALMRQLAIPEELTAGAYLAVGISQGVRYWTRFVK